jgi:NAD(P)-dependent dehydrogenase (short-subunit alcohol dehydrogenase family)
MHSVALITGTSTGLGEAIALKLAAQGTTTYATMRNTSKASDALKAAAAKGNLHILTLDVQSTESVNAAVAQVIQQEGQLDILVNNAGAGFIRTTEQTTEEDVDWVMDVNFNGVVRTTKAVLPHMRKRRSGQIINITSVGGLIGQPFNEFYCAAKFAVEGYTEALASYVQPSFGIKFSLVEPGGIQSKFAENAFAQFQQGGGMADDEYKPILEAYIGGATARAERGESAATYQTSDEVADVVLKVCNQKQPPLRIRTSTWAEKFTALKTQADPDGTKCRDMVIETFL